MKTALWQFVAKRASDVMTQTNKLEWWMILKISLRVKAGVPKTLVKQKLRLHSLYFPLNTLMLTESLRELNDLHSIFRLGALRYWFSGPGYEKLIQRKNLVPLHCTAVKCPSISTKRPRPGNEQVAEDEKNRTNHGVVQTSLRLCSTTQRSHAIRTWSTVKHSSIVASIIIVFPKL